MSCKHGGLCSLPWSPMKPEQTRQGAGQLFACCWSLSSSPWSGPASRWLAKIGNKRPISGARYIPVHTDLAGGRAMLSLLSTQGISNAVEYFCDVTTMVKYTLVPEPHGWTVGWGPGGGGRVALYLGGGAARRGIQGRSIKSCGSQLGAVWTDQPGGDGVPQDESVSPDLHDGRPHPYLAWAFVSTFSCGIAPNIYLSLQRYIRK